MSTLDRAASASLPQRSLISLLADCEFPLRANELVRISNAVETRNTANLREEFPLLVLDLWIGILQAVVQSLAARALLGWSQTQLAITFDKQSIDHRF